MIAVAAKLKGKVDTTIVMPKQNSERFCELCKKQSIPYLAVPLTRITKEFLTALSYLCLFPIEIAILVRVFRREKTKIVHVSGGSWQYKGVIAGKLAGKKVLWHLNDTYMLGFIRGIFYLINPIADGFIFASERTKTYYRPLIKRHKSEYVIPAPVDSGQFNPKHDYPGDENLLNEWLGKFVIGTVSNINPIKGLETLIHSAALLNKTIHNAVFVIVGRTYSNQMKYYESLVKLCNDLGVHNIQFIGGRSDVRPLLKRFDTYVCSSNNESSPISVWEAMAMAKPIISTNVGDVPLYITDDVNGYIVDVGDSDMMANRIQCLSNSTSLRKAFGEKCREIAVNDLDISSCAERHFNAYKDILAQ